jgi:very-short-patch-repair endonuclease
MATQRGNVLVALINNPSDFVAARDDHWYRVPVPSAHKWVRQRWPPDFIAFYLTKIFDEYAYAITYYAKVKDIETVSRQELFPHEPPTTKHDKIYYRLMLEPLQRLEKPILSRRWRRIIFIPTTWEKFIAAEEINDLYDDSPLEDCLWQELKRWEIAAERQVFTEVKGEEFALDFAVYCAKGNLDIETDGDSYHANPEKAKADNRRNNALESAGWQVLRFTTQQVREEAETYCIPTIVETVNKLGGVEDGGLMPRRLNPDGPDIPRQLGLFDG